MSVRARTSRGLIYYKYKLVLFNIFKKIRRKGWGFGLELSLFRGRL